MLVLEERKWHLLGASTELSSLLAGLAKVLGNDSSVQLLTLLRVSGDVLLVTVIGTALLVFLLM